MDFFLCHYTISLDLTSNPPTLAEGVQGLRCNPTDPYLTLICLIRSIQMNLHRNEAICAQKLS